MTGTARRPLELAEVNAMHHAYWFAIMSDAATALEISGSDLRALGIAHESDWRNSWTDSAADLLNNEVGIAIGQASSREELLSTVESALAAGSLYCVLDNVVTTCG